MTDPEVKVLMLKGDKGDGLSDDDMKKVSALISSSVASAEANINDSLNARLANARYVPEIFANADEIRSTYPTGKDGIFIAADTGHMWLFVAGNWVDAGVYQRAAVDKTLSVSGVPADSETVGEAIMNGFKVDSTPSIVWLLGWVDGSNGTAHYDDNTRAISNLIAIPTEPGFEFSLTPAEGKKVWVVGYPANQSGRTYESARVTSTTDIKQSDFNEPVDRIRISYANADDSEIGNAEAFATDLKIDWNVKNFTEKASDFNSAINGVRFKSFKLNHGKSSSTKNKVSGLNFKSGDTFYIKIKSDLLNPNISQVWLTSADGKNYYSIDKPLLNTWIKTVAKNDVENVGLYYDGTDIDPNENEKITISVSDRVLDTYLVDTKTEQDTDAVNAIALKASQKLVNNSGDVFIFFTDPHVLGGDDANDFPKAFDEVFNSVRSVYNNTPATAILNGGDWLTDSTSKEHAKLRLGRIASAMRSITDKPINVVGNHDTNYQPRQNVLTREEILATLFMGAKKTYGSTMLNNTLIYYLDSEIDWDETVGEFDNAMNAYKWEELKWLANSLKSDDKPHSAIFMHIWVNDNGNKLGKLAIEVSKLITAYNGRSTITIQNEEFDFSKSTGRIEFVLAGHMHEDMNTSVGDVPVIMTINDGYNTANNNFDVIVVDYDNRKLHTLRYGNGSDRTFNLNTGGLL